MLLSHQSYLRPNLAFLCTCSLHTADAGRLTVSVDAAAEEYCAELRFVDAAAAAEYCAELRLVDAAAEVCGELPEMTLGLALVGLALVCGMNLESYLESSTPHITTKLQLLI